MHLVLLDSSGLLFFVVHSLSRHPVDCDGTSTNPIPDQENA